MPRDFRSTLRPSRISYTQRYSPVGSRVGRQTVNVTSDAFEPRSSVNTRVAMTSLGRARGERRRGETRPVVRVRGATCAIFARIHPCDEGLSPLAKAVGAGSIARGGRPPDRTRNAGAPGGARLASESAAASPSAWLSSRDGAPLLRGYRGDDRSDGHSSAWRTVREAHDTPRETRLVGDAVAHL